MITKIAILIIMNMKVNIESLKIRHLCRESILLDIIAEN